MGRVVLDREISFSSGHRYWLPNLSEQENFDLFGRWASPFNHGHNYVLRASVAGTVDPATGMVVNIKDIDQILQDRVKADFDLKSLNDEIPAFLNRPPCLENLLREIARRMESLPAGVELVHLKLNETPTLYGEWHGSDEMITVTRIYEFAASHRLDSPHLSPEENERLFGKCNRPSYHGHNYVLEVTISGEPDARTGMIASIDELDRVAEELVVDRYDHHNLNTDLPEFIGKTTTSEVVAEQIFEALDGKVPGVLERIRLHETARSAFEVSRS